MEMSAEEIRRELRSDMVTHRAKAIKMCDQLFKIDKTTVIVSVPEWAELLRSGMDYEIKEIEVALKKGKLPSIDVAVFFRKLVRHVVVYSHQSLVTQIFIVALVIDHALKNIDERSLASAYKDEHRNILIELLDPKIVHAIPFEGFKRILVMLKGTMVDKRTISDPMNLKILRAVSKSLIRDDNSSPEKVLPIILKWFDSLLTIVQDDQTVHASLTSTIAESCTCFISFQDINVCPVFILHGDRLLRVIVQLVCVSQVRDTFREPCLKFLLRYIDVSSRCHFRVDLAIEDSSPLQALLGTLQEMLLTDEHIKQVVLYINSLSLSRNSRDCSGGGFGLAFDDSRSRLHLALMAQCVRHYRVLPDSTRSSQSQGGDDIPAQLSPYTQPRILKRTQEAYHSNVMMGMGMDDCAGKRLKSCAAVASTSASAVVEFNFSDILQSSPRKPSLESYSCAQVDSKSVLGSIYSRIVSNSVATRAHSTRKSHAGQASSAILEGLLLIFVALCLEYPLGEFLDEHGDSITSGGLSDTQYCSRLQVIQKWQLLIYNQIKSNMESANGNRILILWTQCMRGLSNICAELFSMSHAQLTVPLTIISNIRARWNETISILLDANKTHSNLYQRLFAWCARGSAADAVVEGVNCLLECRVLDLTTQSNLWHMDVWQLPFLHDPRIVESHSFLRFLANILQLSNDDAPQVVAVLCAKDSADMTMASMHAESVGDSSQDDKMSLELADIILSKTLTGVHQGFSYLCAWLWFMLGKKEAKLNVRNLAMDECCSAIASLVDASLGVEVVVSRPVNVAPSLSEHMPGVDARLSVWLEIPQSLQIHSHCLTPSTSKDTLISPQCIQDVFKLISIVDGRLVAMVARIENSDEASENLTPWLVINLFCLQMLAKLTTSLVVCSNRMGNELISAYSAFWRKLRQILQSLQKRVKKSLRWQVCNQYFLQLKQLLQSVHSLDSPMLQALDLQQLRLECSKEFLQIATLIRDEALAMQNGDSGHGTGVDLMTEALTDPSTKVPVRGGPVGGMVQPKSRQKPSAAADDDDDFMDDMPTQSITQRNSQAVFVTRPAKSTRVRLSLSSEQHQIYCCTSQCYALTCPDDLQSNQLLVEILKNRDALSSVQLNNQQNATARSQDGGWNSVGRLEEGSMLYVPTCDLIVSIAECLAQIRASDAAFSIMLKSVWDLEWGALGYCRVLSIIYELFRRPIFLQPTIAGDARSSTIDTCINIVFVKEIENSKIDKFPYQLWRCRVMQIECACLLLQLDDISDIKELIQELFVNSIQDIDFRVRAKAAERLPFLLKIFRKKLKVYEGVMDASEVPLLCPSPVPAAASRDDSQNSNNEATKKCPLRVVTTVMAATHMGIAQPDLWKRAMYDIMVLCCSRTRFQQDQRSGMKYRFEPNYCHILVKQLHALASSRGYVSVSSMLRENLQWLLWEWLLSGADGGEKQSSNQDSANELTLVEFPYQLLEPADIGYSFKDFLNSHSNIVFPLIFEMNDSPTYRWKLLTEHLVEMGYRSTDRDVSYIAKANICSILAYACINTNFRYAMIASPTPTNEMNCEFLNRCVGSNVTVDLAAKLISDVVQEVLGLACCENRIVTDTIDDIDIKLLVQQAQFEISKLLEVICHYFHVASITDLLDRCSILELLVSIKSKMSSSLTESAQISACAALGIIIEHVITSEVSLPFVPLVHAALSAMSRLCPLLIGPIITYHQFIVNILCGISMHCGDENAVVTSRHLLGNFYYGIAAIHCALACFQNSAPYGKDILNFVCAFYKSCNKKVHDWCMEWLGEASGVMMHIVTHLSTCPFDTKSSTHPLQQIVMPTNVMMTLSEQLQEMLRHPAYVNFDIRQSMLTIIDLSRQLCSGGLAPVEVLWFKVLVLRDQLLSSGGVLDIGSLWHDEGDLIGIFISELIDVCNFNSPLSSLLKSEAVTILGHLKPPDLYYVSQASLPGRPSSKIKAFDSKLQDLRLRIVKVVHGLLWNDDPNLSQKASALLREWSCLGCLAQLCAHKSVSQDENMKSIFSGYSVKLLSKIGQDCNFLKPSGSFSNEHKIPISSQQLLSQSQETTLVSLLPQTWDTTGKSYIDWVSKLTCSLISDFFASTVNGNSVAKRTQSLDPFVEELKAFLPSAVKLCSVYKDLAEALFPVVIYGIILMKGQTSLAADTLATRFQDHLLSSSGTMVEAMQLGCYTLVFLLRQDIDSFLRKPIVSFDNMREASKTMRGVSDWEMPFSFVLNVDPLAAAAAAVKCGCYCTAQIFGELADERRKCGLSIDQHLLNRVLTNVFKDVHDPDAIYGLRQQSDLNMQATIYAHTGNWVECLSVNECISRSGGINSQVHGNVATALKGLGFQSLLSAYATSVPASCVSDVDTVASEQVWRHSSSSGRMAEMTLSKWSNNVAMEGSATNDCTSDSLLITQATGRPNISKQLNYAIANALKSLASNESLNQNGKLDSCSVSIFQSMTNGLTQESAQHLVVDLSRSQQILEIHEAGSMVEVEPRLLKECVGGMMRKWYGRLDGSSNCNNSSETILSLRLKLLQVLLNLNKVQASEAVSFVAQVNKAAKDKYTAHAVSPIAYQCQAILANHSKISVAGSALLNCEWNLQESKLLWKKGLMNVAVTGLSNNVINVLKQGLGTNQFLDELVARNLLSEALRLNGEWISSKRAATATEIISEYLDPAVDLAVDAATKLKAHTTLGNFTTKLYLSLNARMNSLEWQQSCKVAYERHKEHVNCCKLEAECKASLKNQAPGTVTNEQMEAHRSMVRHIGVLQKEIEYDKRERDATVSSVVKYLLAGMKQYASILELSSDGDVDVVFQLFNLWFSNDTASVNTLMDDIISRTASFKFVCLTYQIFSRLGMKSLGKKSVSSPVAGGSIVPDIMSNDPGRSSTPAKDESFQDILQKLIFKLCSEHPHHTLPQLFALANEKDLGSFKGSTQYKSNMSHFRCDIAKSIVKELKLHDLRNAAVPGFQRSFVCTYEKVIIATIELANCSTEEIQKKHQSTAGKDFSFKELQGRSNSFSQVVNEIPEDDMPGILTVPHKIDKHRDYGAIVKLVKYKQRFTITDSGISRPKIIECLGSDGNYYRQLVKGGDDMRQDAVMEQVFESLNHTFSKCEETRKRKLKIRTYKIVPLTPQTGILEFVLNTQPFNTYLVGKDIGAHARYFPKDWTHSECKEYLKDAKDIKTKESRFLEICQHFHPAFRFYFLEKYGDPMVWMASRLAYTRSVAVTSIVGHILGIGDRHAHNIMIDSVSAEVVHIDFGMVFEQGKNLPCPEIIPFRLSRDVIDGMGITACEGAYRRSCEEVLRVLRESTAQLLTILEVVIHDPLYKWSLSPLQVRQKQPLNLPDERITTAAAEAVDALLHVTKAPPSTASTSSTTAGLAGGGGAAGAQSMTAEEGSFGRDAAERTLSRIKSKLQGYEDPAGEGLGIEGHIELLINEATNKANLCRMFVGWAPWL